VTVAARRFQARRAHVVVSLPKHASGGRSPDDVTSRLGVGTHSPPVGYDADCDRDRRERGHRPGLRRRLWPPRRSSRLLARGEAGLSAAATDVERRGDRPFVLPVDVADADAVLATAKRIEAEVGLVDIWVNVAFTSVFAPLDRISGEEYRRVPRSVTSATCRHLETAVTLTHSHRLRRSSA